MMRWLAFWLLLAWPAWATTTQWVGVYSCAQGASAMKLTIIDDDPARLTAVLAFGPTPANAAVPRGSYTLRGARRGDQVELRPEAWLEQPPGYEMVGLRGSLEGDLYQGQVGHASCGAFSVQRRTR